ncbi:MAG: chromosomal replication initiator protein DnaA [Deltaproteobacteria bacterium]|nr:chromosomal replication initiator protein DnaA [Deltaproteobacteria bacterium]MBI2500200.1 chromosomal replication initiator protein DnaA [Deltaproteobacteria bacterium]
MGNSRVFSLDQIKENLKEVSLSPSVAGQVEVLAYNDEEGLTLSVKNKFVRDWVREYHLESISAQLFALTGKKVPIRLVLTQETGESPQPNVVEVQPVVVEDRSSFYGLNPKYTFENFVVGSSNQFAHAAAQAVSRQPVKSYNPLFLYGGVGLGKTHLLNAIGHALLKNDPQTKILYLSGEKFVNELIQSLRFEKMGDFRKKYRETCDVLLVDDVQFIGGKEKSQEEFFHTFNQIHESARQIVLTSDRVPREIPGIEDRLRSRFEWGLIADIRLPDLETRVAILKKKADQDKIDLGDDVALFLATHITSNVRELEGALIRVNAFASLANVPITIPFAKEVLKNVIGKIGHVVTVLQVQKAVSEFFGIRMNDLTGKRRIRGFANPRQIAMYLCRKHVKASFPEIGSQFGGKDHSTVVHAVAKIEKKLQDDEQLRDQLKALEQQLTL